ncbi:MAG: cation diffusion facilitator family transporter [Cupriavidus sp.]|nr:MAG: cation diffusion facilitator family transporter [Cupriavidus sp.]
MSRHEQNRHRTLVVMVWCESMAFVCTLAAAWVANSLTLWANCLRVGVELPASFFALYVSARILRRQVGKFEYGLGKWENLASLVNVPVMFVGLVFLAVRAVQSLFDPRPVEHTGFGLVVLLVFACVNVALAMRFRGLLRAEWSPLIHAQYVLYRNAACASFFSIVTLGGAALAGAAGAYLDIVGALAMAVLIVQSALLLLRQSLSALLDEAVEESIQARIDKELEGSGDRCGQVRRIRSRHAGNRIFVEVEVLCDSALPVGDFLRQAGKIRAGILRAAPGAEVTVIPCDEAALTPGRS